MTTRSMTRVMLGVLLSLVVMASVGCASTSRPTESIRTSADRAYDRGQFEAASNDYAEIIARYPGDWQAQYQYGRCQLELDQPANARRALEIAQTRRPEDPDVVDALAEALYELEEESHLYALLRQQAEATGSPRAWLRLADYANRLGDPDSASMAIETAIRVDDGNTTAPYIAAADFNQSVGRLDAAVRRLRQAHWINPADQNVVSRLKALGEVPGPTLALPPDE